MLLDGKFKSNVGYIVTDGAAEQYSDPRGTVFFVSATTDGLSVNYSVTARHVVETLKSEGFDQTFIRFNPPSDVRYREWPVTYDQWVFHPSSDVAISELDSRAGDVYAFPALRDYDPHWERHASSGEIHLGKDVFCIGLFVNLPGVTKVDAVVRFGRVSLEETTVPLIVDAATKRTVDAKVSLIDMQVWGGSSGSPVYAYTERSVLNVPRSSTTPPSLPMRPSPTVHEILRGVRIHEEIEPRLVGLLHGHFTVESGGLDLNSGIAIMVPLADVFETLKNPRFMEARKQKAENAARRAPEKATQKPDIAGPEKIGK